MWNLECANITFFGSFQTKARNVFVSLDAPRFDQSMHMLYAGSLNENARILCTADGNPRPIIEWRRGRRGDVLSRGEVLHRQKIQPDDFGTYTCTATVEGFPPISKEIILAKKSTFYTVPATPAFNRSFYHAPSSI